MSSYRRRGLGRKFVELSKSIGNRCLCKCCVGMVWEVWVLTRNHGQKDETANSFLQKVGFKTVETNSVRFLNENRKFKFCIFQNFFVCWYFKLEMDMEIYFEVAYDKPESYAIYKRLDPRRCGANERIVLDAERRWRLSEKEIEKM